MSKSHYADLLAYDRWANNRALDVLERHAAQQEKALRLLAHVVAAKRVWYERFLSGRNQTPVWPEWSLAQARQEFQRICDDLDLWFDQRSEAELVAPFSYYNSRGDVWEDSFALVLTHIVNHGTHHRAQAVALLRAEGIDVPPTDYIYYRREPRG